MAIEMKTPTSISDLSNKIALITGASSGLGAGMARAFVAAGAYVVNSDLNPNPPKGSEPDTPIVDVVNSEYPVSSGPPRMAFVETNVTSASSIKNAIDFTVEKYGRLDIMVNNAGIGTGANAAVHLQDDAIFDRAMGVNVKGVWLGTKYAAEQFLKQEPHITGDRGWIINSCSIAALVSVPNGATYCLTKGAVMQFTRATACEYAPDRIHINAVNPSFVSDTTLLQGKKGHMGSDDFEKFMTEKHPWGRMATTDDIAKVAVFMAGSGVQFMTGQPFVVDGGYVLP